MLPNTTPPSRPLEGYILFSEGGHLKARGPDGTVTTIAVGGILPNNPEMKALSHEITKAKLEEERNLLGFIQHALAMEPRG